MRLEDRMSPEDFGPAERKELGEMLTATLLLTPAEAAERALEHNKNCLEGEGCRKHRALLSALEEVCPYFMDAMKAEILIQEASNGKG